MIATITNTLSMLCKGEVAIFLRTACYRGKMVPREIVNAEIGEVFVGSLARLGWRPRRDRLFSGLHGGLGTSGRRVSGLCLGLVSI